MSNIVKDVYLDLDSGVLVYEREGEWRPVATSAQLDPSKVRIDQEGHMYLTNFEGLEYPMIDSTGNLISLKGKDGKDGIAGEKGDKGEKGDTGQPGKDGKDGGTPSHLELSDDYNQLYVLDLKIVHQDPYRFFVSYYIGSELQLLSVSDVNILDLPYFTIHKILSGKKVAVVISPKTSVTCTEKNIKIPISIGLSSDLIKNFTLITLESRYDYDLYLNKDIVRASKNDAGTWVLDENELLVIVARKTVGQTHSTPTIITTLPNNYSLSYLLDGIVQKSGLTHSETIKIPLINDNGQLPKKVTVELWYNNNEESTLIDWAETAILPDGEKGDPGLPGASTYYIDLDNDFDQVYNKYENGIKTLLPNLVFSTEVRLYKGASLYPIPENALTCIRGFDNSDAGIDVDIDQNGVATITINLSSEFIPNSLLDKNNISYKVTLNTNIDGESVELHKTIRLANITGTDDYDLSCNVTIISKDGDGQLYENRPVPTFSVTHKDLSGLLSSIETLDTLLALQDRGLLLRYIIDGTLPEDGTDADDLEGIQVSLEILNLTKDFLKVSLYDSSNRELDYVILDVILDGLPGQTGESVSQLVCASGNIYTFYLNKEGHALQETQTWTPEFLFVSNGVSTTVSPEFSSSELISDNVFIVSTEQTYEPGQYQIVCQYEENGKTYDTTLTINLVVGATYYDLKTTPAYIKYNPNTGIFDPILIEVYLDCSGGGYSEESLYYISPDSNLRLMIEDGDSNDSSESLTYNNGKATFNPQSTKTTTIKLIEEEDIKDFQILSVISDGTNGEIKTEIANEFLVEGIDDKLDTVVAGLTKDPVFFWGGGTKDQAQAQETPLYFNTDGTGKIGVFEIGGDDIEIINSENEFKTIFTTSLVSETVNRYKDESKPEIKSSGTKSNIDVTSNTHTGVIRLINSIPITAGTRYAVSTNLILNFTEDNELSDQPVNPADHIIIGPCSLQLKQHVENGTDCQWSFGDYRVEYRNSLGAISRADSGAWVTPANANNFGWIDTNRDGQSLLTADLIIPVTYSASNPTWPIVLKACKYAVCLSETPPATIIGADGIGVVFGKNSFILKPTSADGIYIDASGLPANSNTLVSGQLYQESGYIKIVQ